MLLMASFAWSPKTAP